MGMLTYFHASNLHVDLQGIRGEIPFPRPKRCKLVVSRSTQGDGDVVVRLLAGSVGRKRPKRIQKVAFWKGHPGDFQGNPGW